MLEALLSLHEKGWSLRRVAVRFSDTLLKQFFPLVQPVYREISFIWIGVLRRQVDAQTDYFSCMNISPQNYYFCCFCLTFFSVRVLKRTMHYLAVLLRWNTPGTFLKHCCSCFKHYKDGDHRDTGTQNRGSFLPSKIIACISRLVGV